MNLEPEQNEKKTVAPEKRTIWNEVKRLPPKIWRVFLHNLPWKLLAIFLAICLWAGLITQDPTLTRERVFVDVPVTMMGADTLLRNGMVVVTDWDQEPLSARLSVDVPQREYNTVTSAHYNPRIDLTRITQTGRQALKIATTSTTAYGTVREVVPDSIEVVVDEYITNYRVPVNIERAGQYPKGFYGTTPSLDPAAVSVSGPKSIIDQIARVIVDFDVSHLPAQAGLIRTAMPMRFVDRDGKDIVNDLIDVTSAGVLLRSVVVEQTLYATKTLPISSLALTTGVPAAGCEVKSVTATPNILVAAGDEIGLKALDSLFLEKAVDVSGQSESFTVEVEINQPSELVYLSAKTVTLSIEIGPTISVKEFDGLKLLFWDQTEKRTVHSDLTSISLTLTGPSTLLDGIKPTALTAYVDVTELPEGEHELPILLNIDGVDEQKFTYDISPKLAKLRIEIN